MYAIRSYYAKEGILAFHRVDPVTLQDLLYLRTEEAGDPQPLLVTPSYEGAVSFSPDGRWFRITSYNVCYTKLLR